MVYTEPMRTGLGMDAYTIVEVMIFLAVSSLLFALIAGSVNGQQSKTQFVGSARNFESRLLDLANDVSTGLYDRLSDYSCSSTPTTDVAISAVGVGRGQNSGCIFVGQVLQFTPGKTTFLRYPVVGKQQLVSSGIVQEAASMTDARPLALVKGSNALYGSFPAGFNQSRQESMLFGATVRKVTYDKGVGGPIIVNGFMFATTFASYNSGNPVLSSGDVQTNLVPLQPLPPTWVTPQVGADYIASLASGGWNAAVINPLKGIAICLEDSANNPKRHADLVLGGSGRQLTTNLTINEGVCT